METVNNAVNAASKMIWGDTAAASDATEKQTTEPLSGETGAGTLSDPYDKGNTDCTSLLPALLFPHFEGSPVEIEITRNLAESL